MFPSIFYITSGERLYGFCAIKNPMTSQYIERSDYSACMKKSHRLTMEVTVQSYKRFEATH